MRFIVDEESLGCRGAADWAEIEDSFYSLAELLRKLRANREEVGIVGGWGGVESWSGDDLGTFLLSDRNVDREVRGLLLRLLDKCVEWDGDISIAGTGDVVVAGREYYSLGTERAAQLTAAGRATAVVTLPQAGMRGYLHTGVDDIAVDLCFVVEDPELRLFYRSLFTLDDVPESGFFELAAKAFTDLCFAPGITFRNFVGGYSNRDAVVRHLTALNDHFSAVYVAARGNSAEISSRLGVEVSIEGNARGSERLMKLRDVEYRGEKFRCEWHSKLERHQNRIHFHPGNGHTEGKVLVGIFTRHLPT